MSNPTTPDNASSTDGAVTLPPTMRAAVRHSYGDARVLEVAEIEVPSVLAGDVLVRVEAASLNPLDFHTMTGTPWLMRLGKGLRTPTSSRLGTDVTGRVAALGADVGDLAVGDAVLGMTAGAFAEFVTVPASKVVRRPDDVSPEQAAGAGVAAVTALQALRDQGEVEAGHHVLVNGAAGGVGTAAIQIARWLGAEVTAVCSTRNVELVESLGAHRVVDYTVTDFADTDTRYDVVVDNQGNRPIGAFRRLLTDDGTYVVVGGPKHRITGPMARMAATIARFSVGSRRARAFIAQPNREDLSTIAGLLADGQLRTVVDSTYPLDAIGEAMTHLSGWHTRGKIIVTP